MCGIAGFWDPRAREGEAAMRARLKPMADALRHRGPDDQGSWIDAPAGIALGHRRLSIIDLSAAGHQPMVSSDGRFCIAFNGEIYNFAQLRAQLEASEPVAWRGHSDTEVFVEAIRRWGLRKALSAAVGMFAFAVWDRQERCLALARDRLGEKPLYYGWHDGVLLFGSELKSVRAYPGWQGSLDPSAVSTYLHYGYIPAPHCVFTNVRKLAPGHWIRFDGRTGSEDLQAYWSAADVTSGAGRLDATEDELSRELERLLGEAVAGQMVSDVPLGAFLSGGIDSSTIVALMQQRSARPVRTFTIGFQEGKFNEAPHAAAIATHLGTDHTELTVTPREAMDVIPQLTHIYDEPFADSSQIPTILVSRLARRHVTVTLSGDGGDELFAGYGRYARADTMWRRLRRVPQALREAVARPIHGIGPTLLNRIGSVVDPLLSSTLQAGLFADRAYKAADVLTMPTLAAVHERLVAHWPDPVAVLSRDRAAPRHRRDLYRGTRSGIDAMMATDLVTWLPDDVLAKLDRAAMSASLESRVPLLDHRVVEFAWRLPASAKLGTGGAKHLLRTVLARHVPARLFERPKMGFSMPIGQWLRGPLREWAEPLLSEARLKGDGLFDPGPVKRAWQQHQRGVRDLNLPLWNVLIFQAWIGSGH